MVDLAGCGMSGRSKVVGVLFLAAMTSGLAAQTAGADGEVESVWTEFVGDAHVAAEPAATGHVVLRVITRAATCPAARADGRVLRLTVREAVSAAFPVTTCEGRPPVGTKEMTVAGRTVFAAAARLQRIVVLGDTGCRLKGALVQDCNDPVRWPFSTVAAHAAAKRPDLVIHVGDYYYRESACPAGAAGCAGSPHGDAWPAWKADFFDPVGPLLRAAPWIFVRGNHEQCGRGADGWFRFLDAADGVQDCAKEITAPPFTVRWDGLTMNVMDSADTDDTTAPERLVALFTRQYEELGSAAETGHGWILTHRPIWGLDPKVVGKKATTGAEGQAEAVPAALPKPLAGYNAVDYPSNRTEQVASDARALAGTEMVLSGHVHLFTALSYGAARPVQMIVGNGGDNPNVAVAGPGTRKEEIDGKTADVYQLQRYGYFVMDRTKDGWLGTAYSLTDDVLGTCSFVGRTAKCLLTQALPVQAGPTTAGLP